MMIIRGGLVGWRVSGFVRWWVGEFVRWWVGEFVRWWVRSLVGSFVGVPYRHYNVGSLVPSSMTIC